MKDRYDEDLQKSQPHERLEVVAFHLTQLYQRLSQDVDRWSMTGGDLAQAIEIFKKQTYKFATLNNEVKEQLTDSVKESSKQVARDFGGVVEQVTRTILAKEITSTVQGLLQTVQKVERTLMDYQRQAQYSRKWNILINFLSALSGGTLGGIILYYLLTKI